MKTSKMDKQTVIVLNNKKLLFRKITLEDKDAVMDLFSNCEEYFTIHRDETAPPELGT